MSALSPESVYQTSIRQMSREEKLRLVEAIEQDLERVEGNAPRMSWEVIKRLGPFRYWHEDPQDWISRTRREADESRAKALRWDR